MVTYQLDETIPAGESLEVTLPEEVEAGEYPYEVAEGGETVFEGNLIVESRRCLS